MNKTDDDFDGKAVAEGILDAHLETLRGDLDLLRAIALRKCMLAQLLATRARIAQLCDGAPCYRGNWAPVEHAQERLVREYEERIKGLVG